MLAASYTPLLLLYLTHTTNAYHLTLSILEWKNASTYCQNYCNSHLASFHSDQDYFDSINHLSQNKYVYKDVWIGLNDMQFEDVWQWSDGSTFDFGGNLEASGKIVRSQFPWRSGEPDPLSPDDAVAIEITRNLEWSDREQFGNYHFFCGSCDGKLEKYVAINGYKTRDEANIFCADTFGTSLASIHSARDMDEAQQACRGVTNGRGCWVGLNDETVSREYEWDDGTDWKYGTTFKSFPWYNDQPGAVDDQKCIQIDPPDYLFNDDECISTARTICNAPSEICDASRWKNAEGEMTLWSFSTKPCRLTSSLRGESSNMFIGDREWTNGAQPTTIEFQFRVSSVGDGGSVGVVIYHDNSDCDSYYYVGLWPEYGYVFMGKFVNGQWNSLNFAPFGTFAFSSFYTMTVTLATRSSWVVSLDDTVLMTVSDSVPVAAGIDASLSGKIGVRNVNSTVEIASLFVSGSTVFVEDNSLYFECNGITTTSPSADPTRPPTMDPTGLPSLSPTKRPTTRDETPTPPPSTPSPVRPTVANNPNTPPIPTPFPVVLPPPSAIPNGAPTVKVPTWSAKPTTDSPTGGIPPNQNEIVGAQENGVPSTTISEETMVWLIGIPAGAIMICLVASCVVNLYFCKKEFIEPDDDEEGDFDDGYGDVYDEDMMYEDELEESSITEDTEDRMHMIDEEEARMHMMEPMNDSHLEEARMHMMEP